MQNIRVGEEEGKKKRSPHLCALYAHPLSLTAHPTDIGLNEQDEVHQVNVMYSREGKWGEGGGNPTSPAAVDRRCFPASPVSRVPDESESGSPSVRIKPRLFQGRRAVRLGSLPRPPPLPTFLVKSSAVAVIFYTPNTAGCHPDAQQHPEL